MKKVAYFFSMVLLLAVFVFPVKAQTTQDYSINLSVFEPLPEVDFAAFAVANNLAGAPRIFIIEMEPEGETVVLYGKIEWKENENSSFRRLFEFTTRPFAARDITNQDIGTSDVKIQSSASDSDLSERNLAKGKPSGVYKILLRLQSVTGRWLAEDEAELSFLNPAQTLTIRSPQAGSSQDIGSVIAEWDGVVGASSYIITANVRRNASQSFEEALNSGNPIIDNRDIGNVTLAQLRPILDREWLPGQEIVLQVAAFVPGPGGGTELNSEIINFYLSGRGSSQSEAINSRLIQTLQILEDMIGIDLVERLESGQISLSDIRVRLDDGRILSYEEFEQLLIYMQSNPDAVIDVRYQQR